MQLEYFRQKLIAWRKSLLSQAEDTLEDLRQGGLNQPDELDRASLETDKRLDLRTKDRARKLIGKYRIITLDGSIFEKSDKLFLNKDKFLSSDFSFNKKASFSLLTPNCFLFAAINSSLRSSSMVILLVGSGIKSLFIKFAISLVLLIII